MKQLAITQFFSAVEKKLGKKTGDAFMKALDELYPLKSDLLESIEKMDVIEFITQVSRNAGLDETDLIKIYNQLKNTK